MSLSRSRLPSLPASIARPGFELAQLQAGIVHLGVGGFHRSHMARYTHDLMEVDTAARAWGIVGAGLREQDTATCRALLAQDGLYTLIEREGDEESLTAIGSIRDVILAVPSCDALLDRLVHPAIRIVSMTVTENGYCLDPATKRLDEGHPHILADLHSPLRPRSAIGVIVETARRRRTERVGPFTALSCDNIQGNGRVLREAVLRFACLRDEGLAEWIAGNIAFPGTMVDRITPLPTPADSAWIRATTGVIDHAPVVAEMYRQWVIEDHFAAGRPEWDRVGAQFVDDVAPYEMMKLRLLNASHLAIAGLGQLAGYSYVDEVMRMPIFARFMHQMMDEETGPTLPAIPGVDLTAYKRRLVTRFANPRIKDTVDRINTDAPINLLLDPINSRIAARVPCNLLALALAAWIGRLRGIDERGRVLTLKHPQADLLQQRAHEGGVDPRPVLSIRSLFGDLIDHEDFTVRVGRWLQRIHAVGAMSSMQDAVGGIFGL